MVLFSDRISIDIPSTIDTRTIVFVVRLNLKLPYFQKLNFQCHKIFRQYLSLDIIFTARVRKSKIIKAIGHCIFLEENLVKLTMEIVTLACDWISYRLSKEKKRFMHIKSKNELILPINKYKDTGYLPTFFFADM